MKTKSFSFTKEILFKKTADARAVIEEILVQDLPADRFLFAFFKGKKFMGSQDRRFLTESVYSYCRHKLWAQACGAQLREAVGGGKIDLPILLSLYRDLFFNTQQIHELLPEVSESELQELLIAPTNIDSNLEAISLWHSFPIWMLEKWRQQYSVSEINAMCAALNERPPLTVRVNPLMAPREMVINDLKQNGLRCEPTQYSPLGIVFDRRVDLKSLPFYRKGVIEVQDEASQLAAIFVDPQPTDSVWDVCAGGGGKTLLLSSLMKNQGYLLATDTVPEKLNELARRCEKAHVENVESALVSEVEEIEKIQNGVDRLLIDAPCSGSGTLRRNPDRKWKLTPAAVQEFQQQQIALLNAYAKYVKKDGRLFYATCSIFPDENNDVVTAFLSQTVEFRAQPLTMTQEGLSGLLSEGQMTLLPHKHETDGFYLSSIVRN